MKIILGIIILLEVYFTIILIRAIIKSDISYNEDSDVNSEDVINVNILENCNISPKQTKIILASLAAVYKLTLISILILSFIKLYYNG